MNTLKKSRTKRRNEVDYAKFNYGCAIMFFGWSMFQNFENPITQFIISMAAITCWYLAVKTESQENNIGEF